jgi:YD repeat-containing protein
LRYYNPINYADIAELQFIGSYGSPVSRTAQGTQTTSYQYDSTGNLTQVTDPLGNNTTYTYDSHHNVTSSTNAAGGTARMVYDTQGNVVLSIAPNSNSPTAAGDFMTRYTYNAAGQVLTQNTLTAQAQWTFNEGTGTTVGNALGSSFSGSLGSSGGWGAGNAGSGLSGSTVGTDFSSTFTWSPTNFSVSFWINPTSLSNNSLQIAAANGWGHFVFQAASDGSVSVGTDTATKINLAAGTLQIGSWQHFVFRFDSDGVTGTGRVFKNGQLLATASGMTAPSAWTGLSVSSLQGVIDNVVISGDNRPLITNTYDSNGYLASTTDGNGNTTTFTVNALGERTQMTGASVGGVSPVTLYTYKDGLQTGVTDPQGNSTTYAYDLKRQLVRTTYADGTFVSTQYDAAGRIVAATDADGNTTRYFYDAMNRVATTLYADGSFVRKEYGDGGQTTQVATPLQSVSAYGNDPVAKAQTTYDKFGRVSSTTDASGHTTSYTYDADGNLLKATDPRGVVTKNTYTVLNQLASVETLDPAVVVTAISVASGTATVTAANHGYKVGDVVWITVAGYFTGEVAITTVADGNHFTFAAGGLTGSTSTAGTAQRRAAYTTYSYDSDGNTITVNNYRTLGLTGATVSTTTSVYDAQDRKIFEIEPSVTDATTGLTVNPTIQYVYDAAGRLVSETAPNGTTTFAYDALGRLTSKVEPAVYNGNTGTMANPTTSYEYDLNGNVTSVTDPNENVTTYSHDVKNRQIAVSLPEVIDAMTGSGASPVVKTVYDAAGNVVEKIDALGNATYYRYDAKNRVVMEVDAATSTTADAAMTQTIYDAAGDVVAQVDPLGRVAIHTYDAMHRAVIDGAGVLRLFTAISGTTTGQITSVNNGLSVGDELALLVEDRPAPIFVTVTSIVDADHFNFSASEGIAGHTFSGEAVWLASEMRYTYDSAGNLASVATFPDLTSATGNVTTYTYDSLHRKTKEVDPSVTDARTGTAATPTTSWTYDGLGDVLTVTDPDGNATSFTYDNLGRKASEIDALVDNGHGTNAHPTTTYGYDAAGNLVQVTDPLGNITTTAYDALGRVTSVTQADPDDAGAQTSPVTSYVYDANGNTLSITDPNGNVTTSSYDALNRQISRTDPLVYDGISSTNLHPVTTYGYDLNGNLVSLTDPKGNQTTYAYDRLNQKTSETDPIPETGGTHPVTTYTYDLVGNLIAVTDPLGHTTSYLYDHLNRKIFEIDPSPDGVAAGPVTQYTYDGLGDLLSVTDPDGNVTRYVYS